MTIAEAAETGDRLTLLKSMRKSIAEALTEGEVHPRDMAALTKRIADIAREIEELETVQATASAQGDASNVRDVKFNAAAI